MYSYVCISQAGISLFCFYFSFVVIIFFLHDLLCSNFQYFAPSLAILLALHNSTSDIIHIIYLNCIYIYTHHGQLHVVLVKFNGNFTRPNVLIVLLKYINLFSLIMSGNMKQTFGRRSSLPFCFAVFHFKHSQALT